MPASRNIQITLALIGAVVALGVAAIQILPSLLKKDSPDGAPPLLVTVVVSDSGGSGVEGAKASLAIGSDIQKARTDSLGRHTFEVHRKLKGRVATISVSGETGDEFLPQRVEITLSQPEETRKFQRVARKVPLGQKVEQACPTEEERKCEGVVVTSHETGWTWLGDCKIAVRAREHKAPDSVYFVDIRSNDRTFPRCTRPSPEFFGLTDRCPFEFNGKKWYASLDTVRPQGEKYEAVIRLQRDCRYP